MKDKYELLWNIPDNKGYLELVAIMQKFVDQTISANTNYDPSKFEDGKLPLQKMIQDILTMLWNYLNLNFHIVECIVLYAYRMDVK